MKIKEPKTLLEKWIKERRHDKIIKKYSDHLEFGQSEVRYKYDLSTIDGGKKIKLGNAVALRLSTNTSLYD